MIDVNSSHKTTDSSSAKEGFAVLRTKLIGSSMWVFCGHGLSQGIRLAGNLILTRLLFPEAFGLMALINVFLMGVGAFSDIGLRGSIVHNPRGNEDSFLNTAWTIQIIRACLIWLVLFLCARPVAQFYNTPQLITLLPVVGLTAVIQGFTSTSALTLVRQISLRKKVILDIVTQFAGLLLMIFLAWTLKSVWALVVGTLFTTTLMMVGSHYLIPGYRNRFEMEPEAAKAIIHFGKWIFLSTALTFLGAQGDRIVLGKILDNNALGVYSIAFFLSQAIVFACKQLSGNVLFPVYTQLAQRGIPELRKKTKKIRTALMLITLPPTCALVIWGPIIVETLYDDRYTEAGWMLQILSVRAIFQTVIVTSERILLASGDSFRHMTLQLSKVIFMGGGIFAGYLSAGIPGLLVGITIASFGEYLVMAGLIRQYGVWLPRLDAQAFALSGGLIFLGIYLT